MKINDIYESTTSGSVATVAQPMTGGALKRVGQGVYGKQKGGNLLTGTKKKGPYANSLRESEEVHVVYIDGKPATKSTNEKDAKRHVEIMKAKHPDKKYEIKKEIREGEEVEKFIVTYYSPKHDRNITKTISAKNEDEIWNVCQNKGLSVIEVKKKNNNIKEDELQEDDLILLPGQGRTQRTGFTQHDPDKAEHEGETLKNSLHTIARAAMKLDQHLSIRDDFPEWVSEKIGATKSMITSVMQYLISKQEMDHDPDAMNEIAIGEGGQRLVYSRDGVAKGFSDPYSQAATNWKNSQQRKDKPEKPFRMEKPTNDEIWDKVTTVIGNMFPDGDPIDALGPYMEKNELYWDDLNRAARKNGYKSVEDYWHDLEQQHGQDTGMYPMDESTGGVIAGGGVGESDDHELSEIRRLSGVGEGKKVDRMVKHIEKSEEKAGKSKKEAENIAWATVNKRGYLDNKNHIKGK